MPNPDNKTAEAVSLTDSKPIISIPLNDEQAEQWVLDYKSGQYNQAESWMALLGGSDQKWWDTHGLTQKEKDNMEWVLNILLTSKTPGFAEKLSTGNIKTKKGPRNYIYKHGLATWMRFFDLMPHEIQVSAVKNLTGLANDLLPKSTSNALGASAINSSTTMQQEVAPVASTTVLPPPSNYNEINKWIEAYYNAALPLEYLNKIWENFSRSLPPSKLAGLHPSLEIIREAEKTQSDLLNATTKEDFDTAFLIANKQLSRSIGPKGYIDYFGIDMWRKFFNSLPRALQVKVVADLARIPIPRQLEASHASMKASSITPPPLTSSSIMTTSQRRPAVLSFPSVEQDFFYTVLEEYKKQLDVNGVSYNAKGYNQYVFPQPNDANQVDTCKSLLELALNQTLNNSKFTDAKIITSLNGLRANMNPWECIAILRALNNHHKIKVIEYFLNQPNMFNLLATTANTTDELISILSTLDIETNRHLLKSFFDKYPPTQSVLRTSIRLITPGFLKTTKEAELTERIDILCDLLQSFQRNQQENGRIIAQQLHINSDGTSGTDIKTLKQTIKDQAKLDQKYSKKPNIFSNAVTTILKPRAKRSLSSQSASQSESQSESQSDSQESLSSASQSSPSTPSFNKSLKSNASEPSKSESSEPLSPPTSPESKSMNADLSSDAATPTSNLSARSTLSATQPLPAIPHPDFFDTVLEKYKEVLSANHIPVTQFNILREFTLDEERRVRRGLSNDELESASSIPLGIEGKRIMLLYEVMSEVLSSMAFTNKELLHSLKRFLLHREIETLGGLQLLEIIKVFDEAHRDEIVLHLLTRPAIFEKIIFSLSVYISYYKEYCEEQLNYLISALSHLNRNAQRDALNIFFHTYTSPDILEEIGLVGRYQKENYEMVEANTNKRIEILLDLLYELNKNKDDFIAQKKIREIITKQLILKLSSVSPALSAGTDLDTLKQQAQEVENNDDDFLKLG